MKLTAVLTRSVVTTVRAGLMAVLVMAMALARAAEPASPPATPTPAEFMQRVIEIAKHGDLWDPNFVARQLGVRFEWVPDLRPERGVIGAVFRPDASGEWPPFLPPKFLTYAVGKFPDSVKPRARLYFNIDSEKLCIQLSDVPAELRASGRGYSPTAPSVGSWGAKETEYYGREFRFSGYNEIRLGLEFRWKRCVQKVSFIQNVD